MPILPLDNAENNSRDTFCLVSEPNRRHVPERFDAEPTTQRVLFAGMDCLPGQMDLFATDATPSHHARAFKMPRHMSFFMTTDQVLDRSKTVTRRLGWHDLQPGDLFWAVRKCQGLRRGEKVERLALCRCVSNRSEPLNSMPESDCAKEGFPAMTPREFVAMFCKAMRCEPDRIVQRIEFEYVSQDEQRELF